MTTKPPTPQGISALLRKAGFPKSASRTTALKGWHDRSEGFAVRRGREENTVEVRYDTGEFRLTDDGERRRIEMAGQYAETIRAAGYAVTGEGSYFEPLIVTVRTPGRGEPRGKELANA